MMLTTWVGKFEVNANGQWHWLTRYVDVPMVDAMADALEEGCRS